MQSPGHEPYVDAYMADLREVVEAVRSGELTTTEGRAKLHLTRVGRRLAGRGPGPAACADADVDAPTSRGLGEQHEPAQAQER